MEVDGDPTPVEGTGEAQFSRLEFARRAGAGIAGLTMAGALAPFASAGRSAAAVESATKVSLSCLPFEHSAYTAVQKLLPSGSGITLNVTEIPSNAYSTLLPRYLATGTAADLVEVAAGGGNSVAIEALASAGYLQDLSNEPWVKRIPKSVRPVCSHNGKVYMAPVDGGVMVMFYNKAIFSSLGLTPPTTWQEFLTLCSKLKAAGKIPIWLDASGTAAYSLFLTYPLAASTDVGDPSWAVKRKAKQVTFAKSGWVTALQRFLALYHSGYFSPNATGGAPFSQLANGEAAMFGLPCQALALATSNFKPQNTGAFLLPNATTASKVIASAGSGYGLAVSSKSKNAKAAKSFINFITSPVPQKAFNAKLGGVPLLPSARGAVAYPLIKTVLPVVAAGRTATYFDQYWPSGATQQALISGTQALMTGQQSIPQVLSAMDDAYDHP